MMAVGRSEWMVHPNVNPAFKVFDDSFIKGSFPFAGVPHILPEKILDSFIDNSGVRCYRVKWQDSWLPEQQVATSFPHLVTEFWISKPISGDQLDFHAYIHHDKNEQARSLQVSATAAVGPFPAVFSKPRSKALLNVGSDSTLHHISVSCAPVDASAAQLRPLYHSISSVAPQAPSSVKLSRSQDEESLKLPDPVMDENASASLSVEAAVSTGDLDMQISENPAAGSVVLLLQKSELTAQVNASAVEDGAVRGSGVSQSVASESIQQQYLMSENDFPSIIEAKVIPKSSSNTRKALGAIKSKHLSLSVVVEKSDRQPVQCDICLKMISSQKNLRVHKTVKHFKNGSFSCDICGRKFALSRDLRRHMPLHTNERNYVCPYCGKQCKQPGHLTKHMRVHTEVLNWRCDCCFQTFKVQAELKDHCFKAHADIRDKDLHCSVCKEHLKLPNSVYLHSLRHSGVREFFCRVCNAGFKLKQHMQVHMRTHDRPEDPDKFACEICGREFRHKHALQRHSAKHSEEKDQAELLDKPKASRKRANFQEPLTDAVSPVDPLCERRGRQSRGNRRSLLKSKAEDVKGGDEIFLQSVTDSPPQNSNRRRKVDLLRHVIKRPATLAGKKRKFAKKAAAAEADVQPGVLGGDPASSDNLLNRCDLCKSLFGNDVSLADHRRECHVRDRGDNALVQSDQMHEVISKGDDGSVNLSTYHVIVFEEQSEEPSKSAEERAGAFDLAASTAPSILDVSRLDSGKAVDGNLAPDSVLVSVKKRPGSEFSASPASTVLHQ